MRNAAKTGERNGRLTLVRVVGKRKRLLLWEARCDCGNLTVVTVADLRSGHTRSCGCLRRQTTAAEKTKHGLTNSPEFRIWCHMLGRCQNKTDHKFPDYGGRGIKVCERWQSFENFYADMGQRPSSSHSIDRCDNDGNYEPGNCRWATRLEQAQNKRNNVFVIVHGQRVNVTEAERRLGACNGAVYMRMRRLGLTHQEATDWFANKRGLNAVSAMTGLGGSPGVGVGA